MIFEVKNCLTLKAEDETLRKNKSFAHPKENKEILKKFELNQDSVSTENNEINLNINEENKGINLCSFYTKNLSEQALRKYGGSFFKSFSLKENIILPSNFMEKHKISSFMRSKMVNWMLEIFYTFRSNEETFLAAVEIMDKFIYNYKKKILADENIHLIGMVSIFIASKVYDLYPIQLSNIVHQIGHDQFSQKEILNMEKKIIKTINFDVFSSNSFELIRFLLYDFYTNNKANFKSLNAEKYMDMLTNGSIWIYKMCKHFEEFSSVSPLLLSLGCLLIGYDIMRDNCESFNGDVKNFFKKWLTILFNKVGKKQEIKQKIETIYKDIQKSYDKYKNSSFKNLISYHELYFN